MSTFIEDRIREHFIQRTTRIDASACDYRINTDDFAVMVQRLGAKVERDRPLPDESVPVFVTLHIAGGTTRVYAAADDTPLGEFRESPRPIPTPWFPPGKSDDAIDVGDTVTLNSGGPPMSVVEVRAHTGGTNVVAWWRSLDGQPQILDIDVRCLQLISEGSGANDLERAEPKA